VVVGEPGRDVADERFERIRDRANTNPRLAFPI
jgi:hypothetical protein